RILSACLFEVRICGHARDAETRRDAHYALSHLQRALLVELREHSDPIIAAHLPHRFADLADRVRHYGIHHREEVVTKELVRLPFISPRWPSTNASSLCPEAVRSCSMVGARAVTARLTPLATCSPRVSTYAR